MSISPSVFAGLDTTLPQSIIDRQSDANLRLAAMSAFAALAPGMDTVEGSFAYDLIEPFCLVLAQAYYDLIDIERRNSLATATGLDLDRIGELYAVTRAPAAFAEGIVTFTGMAGSAIPQGTTVSTVGANPQIFTTNVAAAIPLGQGTTASIDVPVTCIGTGADGNVPAGGIAIFGGAVPAGVTRVTNANPMTGGTDIEQDGAANQYFQGYRADIYNLENTRGEGGAAKHLRKWARSVSGVGGVRVLEITPTAGWATVVLLGTTGQPATFDVVHAVEATILDPWYLYNEAESMILGGGAGLDTQSDGIPLGGANNVVKMQTMGPSITQHRVDTMLPQPGVWRLKPRMKVSSTLNGTNLVTYGMWDLNTGAWCYTRPNLQGVPAVVTMRANQFSTSFVQPDIDPNSVDFAWNGFDQLELRITMAGGDVSTILWTDQVNYFAVMSRDDRDVGLSPAGMRVNVVPATSVAVNVSATVTYGLSSGQTVGTVNQAINSAVIAYLETIAFATDNAVRRAAVEEAIFNTSGVADVNNVLLNGALNNIIVAPTAVAVAGTLTWTPA